MKTLFEDIKQISYKSATQVHLWNPALPCITSQLTELSENVPAPASPKTAPYDSPERPLQTNLVDIPKALLPQEFHR